MYLATGESNKYFEVELEDIEQDMTYWELIIKIWNKNNTEQTPKNLLKPYYRNFIEYIDTACFGNEKELDGGRCFTKQDQERTPHFYYRLKTGEEFCILFERAEYLEPIPRKLTQKELDILTNFLNAKNDNRHLKEQKNNWQAGVWLWNDQNYEYNAHAPQWFPKYKKIDENIKMPDYTKLNKES